MEMQQLRHFIAVAKHRKLLSAARQLNMSQSALTRSIKRLEQHVGGALFEREARGMRLTVLGESLATHARIILQQTRSALNELNALKGGSRGAIMIGTGHDYCAGIVPRVVTRFMQERPNVEIVVEEGHLDELLPRIRVGELDVLFEMMPNALDADLKFEPLINEKLIVVARAGHPLASRPQVSREDAVRFGWILSGETPRNGQTPHDFVVRQSLCAESAAVNARSSAFRKAAVRMSDMLTLLPAHAVARELKEGTLVRLAIPQLEHSVPAGIIYSCRVTQPPALDALIKCFRAGCGDLRNGMVRASNEES